MTDNPEYNHGVAERMRERQVRLEAEMDTDDEDCGPLSVSSHDCIVSECGKRQQPPPSPPRKRRRVEPEPGRYSLRRRKTRQ